MLIESKSEKSGHGKACQPALSYIGDNYGKFPVLIQFSLSSFPNRKKDANGGTPLQLADTVDVHQPELLADDEVEGVMSESMDMIVGDPLAVLSVHRLSANRVYAPAWCLKTYKIQSRLFIKLCRHNRKAL